MWVTAESPEVTRWPKALCPILRSAMANGAQAVREVHYLDVGLNMRGAYPTSRKQLKSLGLIPKVRVLLHGTPRQWGAHICFGVLFKSVSRASVA